MKRLIAIALMLALPAVAYAAGGTSMYLKSGTATFVELPENQVNVLPVQAYVDLEYGRIVAIGAALCTGDSFFDSVITYGPTLTWAAPYSQWSYAFGAPANTTLAQGEDIGRLNNGPPEPEAGPVQGQLFVSLELILPPLPYCTYILIRPNDSVQTGLGFNKGMWAGIGVPPESPGDYQPFDNVGGILIHITPEPATILLLAGALPFLRRRKA